MARWQYSLILEGFGRGASEVMYIETEDDSFGSVWSKIPMIWQKRAALLGSGWSVKGDRTSMKINTAGQKVKRPSRIRETFAAGNAQQVCMSLDSSLKVLWTTANQANAKLAYMAGAWESVNPHQNIFDPGDTTWSGKWNDYVNVLKTAKMGWLSNLSPEPTVITGYTFDPITGRTTYTLADPFFQPEEIGKPLKVGVEFPERRSSLDGPQLVTPLTATTAKTTKPRPSMPFVIEGRMRRYVLSFVHVGTAGGAGTGDVVVQRITRRQRGRPLLVSPGRDKPQVRW